VIADNGRGFAKGTSKGSGLGLSGMAKPMNDIGDSINIVSAPAWGHDHSICSDCEAASA